MKIKILFTSISIGIIVLMGFYSSDMTRLKEKLTLKTSPKTNNFALKTVKGENMQHYNVRMKFWFAKRKEMVIVLIPVSYNSKSARCGTGTILLLSKTAGEQSLLVPMNINCAAKPNGFTGNCDADLINKRTYVTTDKARYIEVTGLKSTRYKEGTVIPGQGAVIARDYSISDYQVSATFNVNDNGEKAASTLSYSGRVIYLGGKG